MQDTPFTLAGKTYRSRLLVGTGRYKNLAETKAVVELSPWRCAASTWHKKAKAA